MGNVPSSASRPYQVVEPTGNVASSSIPEKGGDVVKLGGKSEQPFQATSYGTVEVTIHYPLSLKGCATPLAPTEFTEGGFKSVLLALQEVCK